jgi:hypothetical protein
MSASSQSTSTTPSNTQATGVAGDPLDMIDFTAYDGLPDSTAYNSPSLTPETSTKQQFTSRQSPISATASAMSATQTMSGPSHQYDQYKQQTPFVPGALATTLAVNQSSAHVGYDLEYMSTQMNPADDMFDFNSAPSQASLSSPEMDMDFEPSGDASFFFNETTVNPNAIDAQSLASPATVTSNVGRMYPGMHQQAAALAKARAQQQRQQQIIQQQQRQQQNVKQQQQQQQRPKSAQPADPLVEQKITQLLNSMRAQSSGADGQGNSPHLNVPKLKKDEEDMDEDERLLNSEEGKKLSSKERRQLRNKVSARAFRSRRKEYISQLEAEIAGKVTENGELRSQNRALLEENRRLSDLTRMLLSSNAFSGFLDHLSTNPTASAPQQPQSVQRVEQRVEETRQVPKDVNPYAAAQQQQQQVSMVMVPEQTMDFSMLNLNSGDAFNYQPQVFTVLETPDLPEFNAAILAGKSSDAEFESEKSKVEISAIEAPTLLESTKQELPEVSAAQSVTETVTADLDADIFDDDAAVEPKDDSRKIKLFVGIQPEKAFASFDLVDAAEEADAVSAKALLRVQRISASMEATMERLERLTVGL